MSMSATLRCDKCEKVEPVEVPADLAEAIMESAYRKGWTRWKSQRSGRLVDLCPTCSPDDRPILTREIHRLLEPPF